MSDPFSVRVDVEVRWADMDAMGHVNNANYFTYCESARMHYFDAIALSYDQGAHGHGPVVVTATCNFRAQVRHPATLEIGVRATKIGTKSFTLAYEIRHQGSRELVADGSSVVVWVDYAAGESRPVPDDLVARIRALDDL